MRNRRANRFRWLSPVVLVLATAALPVAAAVRPAGPPPFPDARFRLLLDAAALQGFLPQLPTLAAEAVRRGPIGSPDGDAVVVAFLGTAPQKGYTIAIQGVTVRGAQVEVTVGFQAPLRPAERVEYDYPVDARAYPRGRLPRPPFHVVFRTPSGRELFRQTDIRPRATPPTAARREEDVGDPYQVARVVRHEFRDGRFRGRRLVRVHTPQVELFWTPEPRGVVVYGSLPEWLQVGPHTPTCAVTDRAPEAIADPLRGSNADRTLTLGDVWVEVNARHARRAAPIRPESVPQRAWLACLWSVRQSDAPDEWLGTHVVDLYPVWLRQRAPRTVEVVGWTALFHDVALHLRLHPAPAESVPLDLVVLRPPRPRGDVAVGAYLYYGFDRDPTRPQYAVHLGKGSDGRFYTWLVEPETHDLDLYVRLARCEAPAPLVQLSVWNPPPGVRCDTNTAVQAFYTHAGFLSSLGHSGPLTLMLQVVSPQGWRSVPFSVEVP
ncbi:hypothetical protein HRbin32_01418 [bacterium HR32]|nr:hypothetical protein HRbin32_01418 [bacterium HR32]